MYIDSITEVICERVADHNGALHSRQSVRFGTRAIGAMCVIALLIPMLASVSAVSAESLEESAVVLLKEICVAPDTPEAMMTTAEKFAAAAHWKLILSGRTTFPMM